MRKLLFVLFIAALMLVSCAPKAFTEKDLAKARLTLQDLPEGFVENLDSAVQDTAPFTAILEKALFNATSTGKILNITIFNKETANANYVIISFEYFPLSDPEKQQVKTVTKKQDVITCCKLFVNLSGVNEEVCDLQEFISLIKVVPDLNRVGEASIGCSLTIKDSSYYTLGYSANRNALSVIFEGYVLLTPGTKVAPILDLKTMLTLMNNKPITSS